MSYVGRHLQLIAMFSMASLDLAAILECLSASREDVEQQVLTWQKLVILADHHKLWGLPDDPVRGAYVLSGCRARRVLSAGALSAYT